MLIIFITKSLVRVNSARKVWCTQKLKMESCSLDEAIAQSMQLMGISSLKAKQQEAIKAFMNGKGVCLIAYWVWQISDISSSTTYI